MGLCRLNRNPFFSRCPFSATYSSPCWAAVVMWATSSPCSTASCSERTNTSLSSSSRLSISLMTRWRSSTSRRRRRAASNSILELGVTSFDEGPWRLQRAARSPPVQQGLSESLLRRWISAEKMSEGGCWKRKQKDGHSSSKEQKILALHRCQSSHPPVGASSCLRTAAGSCFLSRCEALVLFCLCCLCRRGRGELKHRFASCETLHSLIRQQPPALLAHTGGDSSHSIGQKNADFAAAS